MDTTVACSCATPWPRRRRARWTARYRPRAIGLRSWWSTSHPECARASSQKRAAPSRPTASYSAAVNAMRSRPGPHPRSRIRAERIRGCTTCAPVLPHGPRPIVSFAPKAAVAVIGQAPGSRVHASGVPWDDPSGDTLRTWMGHRPRDLLRRRQGRARPDGLLLPPARASRGTFRPGPSAHRWRCSRYCAHA